MTTQLEFPTAADIAALMEAEPRNAESFATMFALIQADFDEHGTVNPNRIRPKIPAWVYSRIRSSAYSVLRNRKPPVLVPTGMWVDNNDAKGRNQGKPQKLYRLTERIA